LLDRIGSLPFHRCTRPTEEQIDGDGNCFSRLSADADRGQPTQSLAEAELSLFPVDRSLCCRSLLQHFDVHFSFLFRFRTTSSLKQPFLGLVRLDYSESRLVEGTVRRSKVTLQQFCSRFLSFNRRTIEYQQSLVVRSLSVALSVALFTTTCRPLPASYGLSCRHLTPSSSGSSCSSSPIVCSHHDDHVIVCSVYCSTCSFTRSTLLLLLLPTSCCARSITCSTDQDRLSLSLSLSLSDVIRNLVSTKSPFRTIESTYSLI
jgi:hypothetical protein